MCYYGTIPKSSVFGLLNTGISVLKKRAVLPFVQYTGFWDPGIGIPS